MPARRVAGALILVAVVAGAGALWLRCGPDGPSVGPPERSPNAFEPSSSRSPKRAVPGAADAAKSDDAADVGTEALTDGFAAELEAGDPERVREAAAKLRRRVRTDPAAWREAAARLLDPATPGSLREALAFVLGTVESERTDPLLLEALEKFGGTPSFARAALLALGAKRTPPEDDEVFGLGDRPWGAQGPAGLGITVRRAVDDAATRMSMASHLRQPSPVVRRAATVALRHSLSSSDARSAFADTLASEDSDLVAQELGESLVQSAATGLDPAESARLVGLVLRLAADDVLDGLRFRIEDDLQNAPLGVEDRRTLADLAGSTQSYAKRSFAMTVLAGAAAVGGDEAAAPVRGLLARTVQGDSDAAVRDLAARLLARIPADDATVAILGRAAQADPQWNVRYTAIETLAKVAAPEVARRELAAAVHDSDGRVAERARQLLASLAGGR